MFELTLYIVDIDCAYHIVYENSSTMYLYLLLNSLRIVNKIIFKWLMVRLYVMSSFQLNPVHCIDKNRCRVYGANYLK